jgi:Ni/Co efflux regulator RcnB
MRTLLFALTVCTAAAAAQTSAAPDFAAQQRAAAQAQAKDTAKLQGMEKDRQLRTMRSAKLQAAGVPRKEADEAAKDEGRFQATLKAAQAKTRVKKKPS